MKAEKIVVYAPGRTCLFGDHQDYLGLPVIACAIDRYIKITATPNQKKYFEIDLPDLSKKRIIAIGESFEPLQKHDYFGSALRVLSREGCVPTTGYNIHITGNIPINSGTSSSSALLIGWIKFLVTAFGIRGMLSAERLAYLGYAAEVLEHKEPGGMMDHYSIALGGIVHIKTESPFSCNSIPREKLNCALITGISGIKKDTLGLIQNLKKNTFDSLKILKNDDSNFLLKNTKIEKIPDYQKKLPEELRRFFRAAVENHFCTQKALEEFSQPLPRTDLLGSLMNKHHNILRDLLQITVPKIDAMIAAALSAGALGAKIVGSGGGGSIVAIAPFEKQHDICEAIKSAGAKDAYAVFVSNGAFLKK